MKLQSLAIAGATTAIVAGAVIASPAVAADQSASFSQSTLCPGETVTLTANGISDNQSVQLTPPDFFRIQSGSNPTYLTGSITVGSFTWDMLSVFQGQSYNIEVITNGDLSDPTAGTVLSTTSLQILSECAAPAPEPEAEALPNTGASSSTMGALALGAAALGLGGAALARRARRTTASN
jgi:LPXTG-motif cell wall-anchored protein